MASGERGFFDRFGSRARAIKDFQKQAEDEKGNSRISKEFLNDDGDEHPGESAFYRVLVKNQERIFTAIDEAKQKPPAKQKVNLRELIPVLEDFYDGTLYPKEETFGAYLYLDLSNGMYELALRRGYSKADAMSFSDGISPGGVLALSDDAKEEVERVEEAELEERYKRKFAEHALMRLSKMSKEQLANGTLHVRRFPDHEVNTVIWCDVMFAYKGPKGGPADMHLERAMQEADLITFKDGKNVVQQWEEKIGELIKLKS